MCGAGMLYRQLALWHEYHEPEARRTSHETKREWSNRDGVLIKHTGLNQAAGDAGIPQQADGAMDKVADAKVNGDIPFGNK